MKRKREEKKAEELTHCALCNAHCKKWKESSKFGPWNHCPSRDKWPPMVDSSDGMLCVHEDYKGDYPTRLGMHPYLECEIRRTARTEHVKVVLASTPRRGDHVVFSLDYTFYPTRLGSPPWVGVCGRGFVEQVKGRGIYKYVMVNIEEWYHAEPADAPETAWMPIGSVCWALEDFRERLRASDSSEK